MTTHSPNGQRHRQPGTGRRRPARQPREERDVSVKPDPTWTAPVARAESFEDARANLEHTLQVFGDDWDDDLVVTATSNVYGPGIKTGLTWRDLRLIAKGIGAVTS